MSRQALSIETNPLAFTEEEVRAVVPLSSFAAGRAYQRNGKVLHVAALSDGALLHAVVQGSKRKPYAQEIRIGRTAAGKLTTDGICSCYVGEDCKHVTAALLAHAQQMNVRRPVIIEHLAPRPSASDHGTVVAFKSPAAPPAIASPAAPPAEAPLPADIAAWLRHLEQAQTIESDAYPAAVRKRLAYVLGLMPNTGAPMLHLWSSGPKGDANEAGMRKLHSVDQLLHATQAPKFVRPSDRAILRRLAGLGIEGEEFMDTLKSIIATGHGRWAACDGPALTEGPPLEAGLIWTSAPDGRQKAELELPDGMVALRLAQPWYVDPASGAVGPIETEVPAGLLRAMLASPWVAPALAERVRGEISRRLPGHRLPAPRSLGPVERLLAPLQPRLELITGQLPIETPFSMARRAGPPSARPITPLARLSWRYGPVTLAHNAKPEVVLYHGRLLDIVRDAAGEARAAERLSEAGLVVLRRLFSWMPQRGHEDDFMLIDLHSDAWLDFMVDELPLLEAEGWLVEIADDFPIRIVQPSGDFDVQIQEGSGIDWFDLDLGVMVDGERVSLGPRLLALIGDGGLAALSKDAPLLLPLADGRLLAVPYDKIMPILAPLMELFSDAGPEGALRLSRQDAGDLAWLEEASARAGIAWHGGDAVRALGRQLREHNGIPPCAVPAGFRATLRPYQAHGLAWLQFLRAADLGGVLADDMGLGKTVQTLAHLATEQAEGRLDRPALVVCPTSLVANWRSEAQQFSPSLRVLVLHGPDRATRFGEIGSHDLVITTYPLLARDHAVLIAQEWHVVALDEAQTIKNPLAATSKLARTLKARQRLCLSGTPLENHLGELWSLYDFLMPGFLGNVKDFSRRFRTPIEKNGNLERQQQLARRVAPFLLRRTKQEVAADLPPKTAIAEIVEMESGQRAIYESIRLAMHAKVRAAIAKRGLGGSGIIILDALLKLRQACCDPRLLKLTTAKAAKAGSSKLDRLMELLPQMLEDGRRVLLFSQFTSMLALIQDELDDRGIPYVLLTGQTKDRATPVAAFQGGRVALFLISLKAGGTGLNLTAADTVIHYDPWWNPAVEEQATDRAHRIGQDKPVFVYRLITAGTIEEKMQVLKARKQALADGILGASAEAGGTLTEGDLEMLLAPAG